MAAAARSARDGRSSLEALLLADGSAVRSYFSDGWLETKLLPEDLWGPAPPTPGSREPGASGRRASSGGPSRGAAAAAAAAASAAAAPTAAAEMRYAAKAAGSGASAAAMGARAPAPQFAPAPHSSVPTRAAPPAAPAPAHRPAAPPRGADGGAPSGCAPALVDEPVGAPVIRGGEYSFTSQFSDDGDIIHDARPRAFAMPMPPPMAARRPSVDGGGSAATAAAIAAAAAPSESGGDKPAPGAPAAAHASPSSNSIHTRWSRAASVGAEAAASTSGRAQPPMLGAAAAGSAAGPSPAPAAAAPAPAQAHGLLSRVPSAAGRYSVSANLMPWSTSASHLGSGSGWPTPGSNGAAAAAAAAVAAVDRAAAAAPARPTAEPPAQETAPAAVPRASNSAEAAPAGRAPPPAATWSGGLAPAGPTPATSPAPPAALAGRARRKSISFSADSSSSLDPPAPAAELPPAPAAPPAEPTRRKSISFSADSSCSLDLPAQAAELAAQAAAAPPAEPARRKSISFSPGSSSSSLYPHDTSLSGPLSGPHAGGAADARAEAPPAPPARRGSRSSLETSGEEFEWSHPAEDEWTQSHDPGARLAPPAAAGEASLRSAPVREPPAPASGGIDARARARRASVDSLLPQRAASLDNPRPMEFGSASFGNAPHDQQPFFSPSNERDGGRNGAGNHGWNDAGQWQAMAVPSPSGGGAGAGAGASASLSGPHGAAAKAIMAALAGSPGSPLQPSLQPRPSAAAGPWPGATAGMAPAPARRSSRQGAEMFLAHGLAAPPSVSPTGGAQAYFAARGGASAVPARTALRPGGAAAGGANAGFSGPQPSEYGRGGRAAPSPSSSHSSLQLRSPTGRDSRDFTPRDRDSRDFAGARDGGSGGAGSGAFSALLRGSTDGHGAFAGAGGAGSGAILSGHGPHGGLRSPTTSGPFPALHDRAVAAREGLNGTPPLAGSRRSSGDGPAGSGPLSRGPSIGSAGAAAAAPSDMPSPAGSLEVKVSGGRPSAGDGGPPQSDSAHSHGHGRGRGYTGSGHSIATPGSKGARSFADDQDSFTVAEDDTAWVAAMGPTAGSARPGGGSWRHREYADGVGPAAPAAAAASPANYRPRGSAVVRPSGPAEDAAGGGSAAAARFDTAAPFGAAALLASPAAITRAASFRSGGPWP